MSLSGFVRRESPSEVETTIPSPELHEIPPQAVSGRLSRYIESDPSPMNRDGINPTNNDASPEEKKPADSDLCEQLIQEKGAQAMERERYVKWGISWMTPSLILLWALLGFSWAIGHHFYYLSLDGTRAGSSSRQNWTVRFGTALAFLVVASLRAACGVAYRQYIWTLFKRKAFSLDALDKLFSVTSDPTAFASWEFVNHAKIAFLMAIVCW